MHVKTEVKSFPVVLDLIETPTAAWLIMSEKIDQFSFVSEIPSQIIDRAHCKLR